MNTDTPFYRLFQERPATVFELAGLPVPENPAYRLHAEEVKQTAFRLDGVLQPETGRDDLPLIFVETQFSWSTNSPSSPETRSASCSSSPKPISRRPASTRRSTTKAARTGREEAEGQEGRLEGEQLLVVRQLKRRLGTLTAAQQARIQALPADTLGALAEALLDFQTPADLESWLHTHGA